MCEEARALRAALKVRGSFRGPVLLSKQERPINRTTLRLLMKKNGAAAGIPEKLRHFHVLNFAQSPVYKRELVERRTAGDFCLGLGGAENSSLLEAGRCSSSPEFLPGASPLSYRTVLVEDARHRLRAAERVLAQCFLGEVKSQPGLFG